MDSQLISVKYLYSGFSVDSSIMRDLNLFSLKVLAVNRRKKIVTKFQKKDKRANARLHKSGKPAYVSKAQREKLALEAEQSPCADEQSTTTD